MSSRGAGYLLWNNGATARLFSGDDPDQLRGPGLDTIWLDELAKYKHPVECLSNARFTLRECSTTDDPKMLITTTPRPIAVMKELVAQSIETVKARSGDKKARDYGVVDVRVPTFANIANLSQVFIDEIRNTYEGTRIWDQEVLGLMLDDVPGALWQQKKLDDTRIYEANLPPLQRIAVGVDPQAAKPADSAVDYEEAHAGISGSETGIIVAGLGEDGHGYVLHDSSGDLLPNAWAQRTIGAYEEFKADLIVPERNNGGAMVENTLTTINNRLPVRSVWASRGKITRAEPISALYARNMVHHVGHFSALEDEMTSYTGAVSKTSSDRMDALVWALTELMIDDNNDVLDRFNPAKHLWKRGG